MAAVDSLLLSKLVNKNNIQTFKDKSFSSVNPTSIEDLVMNSISTTNTVSKSNPDDIIKNISSIISSINDCVITNKYPTSVNQPLATAPATSTIASTAPVSSTDVNIPSLDTFEIFISKNSPANSITSTSLTPEKVLLLLNTIVTRSVMKTPELKQQIIEPNKEPIVIIKKGYFVVGGNIKCPNDPNQEFQNKDLTNIHFLKDLPTFKTQNLFTNTTPLVNLNNTICSKTKNTKQIYIVGNLYCVNDELIPPDLNDIIGIYDNVDKHEIENNGFLNNSDKLNYNVVDIRKKLKIDKFCLNMDNNTTLFHTVSSAQYVSKPPVAATDHVVAVNKVEDLKEQKAKKFNEKKKNQSNEKIQANQKIQNDLKLQKLKTAVKTLNENVENVKNIVIDASSAVKNANSAVKNANIAISKASSAAKNVKTPILKNKVNALVNKTNGELETARNKKKNATTALNLAINSVTNANNANNALQNANNENTSIINSIKKNINDLEITLNEQNKIINEFKISENLKIIKGGNNYTKKITNKQSNKYTRRNYYDNTESSDESSDDNESNEFMHE